MRKKSFYRNSCSYVVSSGAADAASRLRRRLDCSCFSLLFASLWLTTTGFVNPVFLGYSVSQNLNIVCSVLYMPNLIVKKSGYNVFILMDLLLKWRSQAQKD